MKFNENWLREWVQPDLKTDALAHQLTMAGLEVDAVTPVAGDFSKVVVAEVQGVMAHPDADKLRVCQVKVGDGKPLSIVCGASNVRPGLKVPAALVGARLPGDLKIKKSKLRGVTSQGMLCSATELGLAEQADGLLELPADAPVGEDVRDYLGLEDVSIELGLTPNRGDCLSIAGIAREVGVLNQLSVQGPECAAVVPGIDDTLPVELLAAEDCPRYAGRVIQGIDNQASTPMWLQERLRRCGLRSLGPVVDVTNYVLLELGQPMHAFDMAKLKGGIQVRIAAGGEQLSLLDGQDVDLPGGTLVIADHRGPVALAGIMGGSGSAVSETTTAIFLESAYFNPLSIAGRARSFGLHTDSSHRFERGVAADLQITALERATQLLLEIVGGEAGPIILREQEELLPTRAPLMLREARIERVLGVAIARQEVEAILGRLGMELEQQPDAWLVRAPAFRFDISREEDLIEELGRIHGYNRLPVTRPRAALQMPARPEGEVSLRLIRRALVDCGYQEAITYSFVAPQWQELLDPEHSPLPLANPLSADLAVMRTTLWPGLLQALQHNLHRQQNRISLFECGLNFVKQNTELKQEMVIAGVVCGDQLPEQWGIKPQPVDLFDVKAHVESLLHLTGMASAYRFCAEAHPALHPGQSAAIYRGKQRLGWIGALHPLVARKLDINQQVYLFELELAGLRDRRIPEFQPLSRFPAIRRDLAIVVDQQVTAAEVEQAIRKGAPEILRNIELFDLYEGEGIDSGRKSLALGLTLQDLSRTLTDDEVENVMARIIGALETRLGASLRE